MKYFTNRRKLVRYRLQYNTNLIDTQKLQAITDYKCVCYTILWTTRIENTHIINTEILHKQNINLTQTLQTNTD